jgi:hypothetical protein
MAAGTTTGWLLPVGIQRRPLHQRVDTTPHSTLPLHRLYSGNVVEVMGLETTTSTLRT